MNVKTMFLRNYLLFVFLLGTLTIFSQKKNLQKLHKLVLKGELEVAFKITDSLLKQDISLYEKGYLTLHKARIFRLKGNNKLFLKELETIFKIAKKLDNKILEAEAWLEKVIYLNIRRSQSITALSNFISIAEYTQDMRLLHISYSRLITIYIKGNNTKKARYYYVKSEEAWKNWKKVGNNGFILNLQYANILKKEGRFDLAVPHLKKMLTKARELDNNLSVAQAMSLLGFSELNNKNYKNSFRWSSNSHQLANKINHQLYMQSSFANTYLLLYEVSNTKNNVLFDKICTFFNATSLESATINVEKKLPEINKEMQREKVLLALSLCYQKIGKLKKAIYYKEKWSDLKIERIEKEQLDVSNFMNLELAMSNLNKEKKALEIENELSISHKIILALSTIIVFILGLFFWNKQKLKTKSEKLSKITAEINLLKETEQKIALEKIVIDKELELNVFIKDMIEKNSQIKILEEQLKNSKTDNLEDLETIKFSASKNWSQFVFKFKQLHPNFLEKLNQLNTTISPTETKLSMLVFLNLTSKEIADLLNISPTSVNQGKYRLKKKLSIDKEKSINQFFQEI